MLLKLLLEDTQPKKCLVFCNTKRMVDNLSDSLHASGYKAIGLHGDLKQNQRNAVMRDFKSGRSKILIATDVAARGIDVDDVEAVFNYDVLRNWNIMSTVSDVPDVQAEKEPAIRLFPGVSN